MCVCARGFRCGVRPVGNASSMPAQLAKGIARNHVAQIMRRIYRRERDERMPQAIALVSRLFAFSFSGTCRMRARRDARHRQRLWHLRMATNAKALCVKNMHNYRQHLGGGISLATAPIYQCAN